MLHENVKPSMPLAVRCSLPADSSDILARRLFWGRLTTMDTSAYATLLVGFALGLRHATDADHLVAVTTLVSHTPEGHASGHRSTLIGAFWGLGHLVTLFAAGGVLVLLRVKVPPRVEWGLELLVALVLVWLGVHTIRNCFTGRYHFHVHQHGARSHTHLHFHPRGKAGHEHASHAGASHRSGPLLVGMAHGLAGTAGLTLLVLSSIPSRALGVLYLLVFGLGALVGMAAFSALLSVPLARAKSRLGWLNAVCLAAGASSGILGAALTWRAFLPHSWPF